MTSDRGNDMPNPVESMLARWPVLYPEKAGADEENVNGETARVREQVVSPLLDSGDIIPHL